MMPVSLHDRNRIEAFLRRDTYLHLYEIGDLDDFFWQYTCWFGLRASDDIQQIALLYIGGGLPVLLGLSNEPDALRALLRVLLPYLPRRMHAHLSGDAIDALADDYEIVSHGPHLKMALTDPARLDGVDTSLVIPVGPAHRPALDALYAASYPGNWFDARMLETGQYFAVQRDGSLVSVAGIHVYSPRYRVAALGNITTHPDHRGQGFGAAVIARLCQSLLHTVDHIGLNVKADNVSAIAVYRKLGFTPVADYHEYSLTLRR